MERRNFLRTVTSGALAAGISPLAFANTRFAESAIIETTNNPEPIQLKNTSYSWVRGFNYQPGYGRHGIDTWCNFKPKIIQREIFRGKELFPEMTALRIWLSFDA
ncbi:MAG: twin-arginine translocation signal domain-containing protein, partial [Candidatus Symbiothrix sp.]|nr:twin-arginine translocation signal domain-containing protein [Candidatus Symbiothrix sp.]